MSMIYNLPTLITDTLDETGVAAFTAQSRTKWAEVRERLEKDPVNRASLEAIDSAYQVYCLETEAPKVSTVYCNTYSDSSILNGVCTELLVTRL